MSKQHVPGPLLGTLGPNSVETHPQETHKLSCRASATASGDREGTRVQGEHQAHIFQTLDQ